MILDEQCSHDVQRAHDCKEVLEDAEDLGRFALAEALFARLDIDGFALSGIGITVSSIGTTRATGEDTKEVDICSLEGKDRRGEVYERGEESRDWREV